MVVHAWYPRTDSDLSISLQLPPPSCDTLCAECRPVFGPTATFLRHYALCRPVFGARYRHPLVTLCAVSPLVNSYPIYAARSTAVYAARSQYACNLATISPNWCWCVISTMFGYNLTATWAARSRQRAARLVFRFRPHTSQGGFARVQLVHSDASRPFRASEWGGCLHKRRWAEVADFERHLERTGARTCERA